jgi:long-subunit acyl-CoA synthetase (AMP-forming)
MSQHILLQSFLAQVKKHPEKTYLNQPVNRQLEQYSWQEVEQQARKTAQFLREQGLKPGDRVAIFSKNCAHWFIADIAIMMAGLISVPIYHTAGSETISYVLEHSDSKAIFIGKLDGHEEYDKVANKPAISIAMPYPTVDCNISWDKLLEANPISDSEMANSDSDEMFSISYTSGTTGAPKGVELTPNMLVSAATPLMHVLKTTEKDRSLSYLPLAHITERVLIETGSFLTGVELFFVENIDTFIDDLKAARVTTFFSVPRLWHKFKDNVQEKLPPQKLDKLLSIPLVSNIISKVIRKKLGLDHAHTFGSGTAPIDKATLRWYKDIGIAISEGWGLTESAAVSTCNLPYNVQAIGTIGKPFDGTLVKISNDGEIMLKGDSIFKRYYKNPEATEKSFSDGWFHTGDMGSFDSRGNIQIIGRIKEQFKTSKGKYVTPSRIESLLVSNPYIEQVCVFGRGQPQPIAVATVNEGVEKSDEVLKSLEENLALCNSQLESHEKVNHFVIVADPWTPQSGLVTPTLKLKRAQIEEKYQHLENQELKNGVTWG